MTKQSSKFVILLGILLLTGCISVNTTKLNEQPWVGNPFDMYRSDYQVIKEVEYEFTATYVLGIGGWKCRKINAVEELCKNADLSKHQQVVNITYNTDVNCILGVVVVMRVTSAHGTLIQFNEFSEADKPEIQQNENLLIQQNVDKVQAVDLGLSVKWCTMNIGASNEHECGNYFAWGETVPKQEYSWSTYKLCNGNQNNLTKYCSNVEYGKLDKLMTLDSLDDAASVLLGEKWRIPTSEEWDELVKNCDWKWQHKGDANGYLVISKKNGNSIFLPAVAYKYKSNAVGRGMYWSSTCSDNSTMALAKDFMYLKGPLKKVSRDYGLAIRPVCP